MFQLNPRAADQDIRAYLRDATRAAHTAAEARWTQEGRFADLSVYRAWLGCMRRVHDVLGVAAAALCPWPGGPEQEALRLDALDRDRGRAGATGDCPPAGSAPGDAPVFATQDAAWGGLYALNGSAMGAGVLLRGDALGAGWPRAYLETMQAFAKSGALTTFFKDLDAAQPDPKLALRGALQVFTMISEAPGDSQGVRPESVSGLP